MASPVALTIESVSSSDRAELGSSFSKQRSYGTVTEASAALTGSGRLLCGYTVHQVHEQDTLPGLALRYGVTVHHIQKLNNLWDSETIHSRTTLKIPLSSSSPSPTLRDSRNHRPSCTPASPQDLHRAGERERGSEEEEEEEEEEVKRKPSALRGNKMATHEPFQEKSIASLLSAADERIAEMQIFNEKLALKTAHLRQPADAYNSPRVRDSLSPSLSNHSETSSPHSSLEIIVQRGGKTSRTAERRRKLAQESSDSLSNSKDTIEDHLFEL